MMIDTVLEELVNRSVIEARDGTIKAAIETCEEVVRQGGNAQMCVNMLKCLQELFNKTSL